MTQPPFGNRFAPLAAKDKDGKEEDERPSHAIWASPLQTL